MEAEGVAGRLLTPFRGDHRHNVVNEPSIWLAFRFGEHGTATLVDFTAARHQRLQNQAVAKAKSGQMGEVYTLVPILVHNLIPAAAKEYTGWALRCVKLFNCARTSMFN
jgi:hypothetical protein